LATLGTLAEGLRTGALRSRDLVEEALGRIEAPGGQGSFVYLAVYSEGARKAADLCDRARAEGRELPPLAGIPISIKDLFDVAGDVTRAGSLALDGEPPARADAEAVRRLWQAGLIVLGKTNMTEFAFSGLGINPHFGTPANPADETEARIPGGSSSGAAVSVASRMAAAAIGTDTGGSVRIPAAFCGLTGFKSTQGRVPREGVFPLAGTLDSIGPIARSVSCCARLDSILSGGSGSDAPPVPLAGTRLGVVASAVTGAEDAVVAEAMAAALERLAAAGARLMPVKIPEFDALPALNRMGGIVGAEAFALHRARLERAGGRYDPFVRARIEASRGMSAADYIHLLEARARIRRAVAERAAGVDALVLPTVPIVAPRFADLAAPEAAVAINRLCLRHTALANFLDVPAITLPCQREGALPVGLMLMGRTGADRRLLALSAGLEAVVRG
jgi:aspartyl-tRNA(Asn)/glutamyl-tRNA(Gln) amidotransferase subunit A